MRDFTAGNITRSIVMFAIPMLIGNVFQQFYNMADAMIVGRYVGGSALAAVGSSGTVLNFLIAIMSGLATGSSVVVSQFFGARQEDNLRRTVSTSLIFLTVLSLIITVFGILFMPTLMRLLDMPADVFDDTVLYLRILMTGILVQMIFNMYNAFLRALGDSRTPLICLICGIFLNLGLDIWFVRGLGWGVAGAAAATVLAQVAVLVPCYIYVARRVPLLKVDSLAFDRELFYTIMRYSVPAALQLSMTSLASLTIMRLVNGFGSNATAGYTTATKIDQMALMPASNISMAEASFVGQNMGAGKEDRAHKGLRSTAVFMVGLSLAISALILAFGSPLMALFMEPGDPNFGAIVNIGTRYLAVIALFYFLHAALFALNGFFRGVGDAVIVMVLTVTSLTIRSVSAHILVHQFGMGPEAVAWSIPIGWFTTSLMGYIYYQKGYWKGKVAVKQPPKEEPHGEGEST